MQRMTVTSFESSETHIYYWPRCFVMRTGNFRQEFREKPYQRLSATLIANPTHPFTLLTGESGTVNTQLALLSPTSRRRQFIMDGGDGFLFDIDITTEAYRRIKPLLPMDGSHQPDGSMVDIVLGHLETLKGTVLSTGDAITLFNRIIDLVAEGCKPPRELDARIKQILGIIDTHARDEITVSGLAETVGLSESRLRSLVQSQLGCNLARFLRWTAAWKTAELWRPGITYTEVAHAAGFHDLSHANRTFVELFGMPPTKVLRSENIHLHRCEP